MRGLLSLDDVGDDISYLRLITSVSGATRPQCVPNLRRLVTWALDFRGHCYTSLQELVCPVRDELSEDLFRYCPNLIRAEFSGRRRDAFLPRGPVPSSIQEIVLHGEALADNDPDGIDFAALRTWAGEHIPQLKLLGARSLDTIVRELCAAHSENTSLTVSASGPDPDIVFANAEQPSRWCWAVRTLDFWGSPHCAGDVQQLFTAVQITALTINIDMLVALCASRLEAPHLQSLELVLTGTGVEDAGLSDALSEARCLHAPSLRHLALDVGATDAADKINAALEPLRQNFRCGLPGDGDRAAIRAHDAGAGLRSFCTLRAPLCRI